MRTQSLCGQWKATCYSPEKGTFSFPGAVPGCAFTDLLANGSLSEPFYRFQNKENRWAEMADYLYETEFTADFTAPDAYLEFEGLDTFCTVELNGRQIGECDDAFLAYRFPVGDALKEGKNHLAVRFRSCVREVADKPLTAHAFTGERVYIRRMQCTFTWDWVDRFVTCGVYRPVRLCAPETAEIESVFVRTDALDQFGALISAELTFAVKGEGAYAHMTLTDPQGCVVWEKNRLIVEPVMDEPISLPHPQLWWPNGYGEQPLYRFEVQVEQDGRVLSRKAENLGIRTLRIVETIDEPGSEWEQLSKRLRSLPQYADTDQNEIFSRFAVVVNGQPILMKGAAWVPCEPFASAETPEKIGELIRLAKEAGMNAIRVWGGGILEQDAFYDACDRCGVLVTQDFLMACATYPEWDAGWFLKRLSQEAQQGVIRLRSHPCLAFWTGDNENAAEGNENMQDYPGRRAALVAMAPVLKQLDPTRPFIPGSPYRGTPNKSQTRGVTHNTFHLGAYGQYALDYAQGKGNMEDYRSFYEGFLARYIAEDPVMGAPMLCSLRRFMSQEDIFGEEKDCWRFHTKNNPSGIFQKFELFDMTEAYASGILGAFTSPEDRVRKLQYMQYENIRVTMENVRRHKWYSSAILYWMYNDCWPASGWSIVDYYAVPKAAYYGFARTAKPVIASIAKEEGQYRVYLCNDSLEDRAGEITLCLTDTRGQIKWRRHARAKAKANSSQPVFFADAQELDPLFGTDCLLLCDVSESLGGDRALWIPDSIGSLKRPAPQVRVLSRTADSLTLQADSFVLAACMDGEYVFSDNFFPMLPGEQRTVSLRPTLTHRQEELLIYGM